MRARENKIDKATCEVVPEEQNFLLDSLTVESFSNERLSKQTARTALVFVQWTRSNGTLPSGEFRIIRIRGVFDQNAGTDSWPRSDACRLNLPRAPWIKPTCAIKPFILFYEQTTERKALGHVRGY